MVHQTTPSPHAMVCACHGKPTRRTYEPHDGTHRYRDSCPVDGFDLGYDGGVRFANWQRTQAHKRAEAVAS